MKLSEMINSGTRSFDFDTRAMGVGGTGADLVEPDFASSVFKLVKEYDALLGDAQTINTPTGAAFGFPTWSAFTAGTTQSEGSLAPAGSPTDGTPLMAFNLVQLPEAVTYAARAAISLQLLLDGLDVDQVIPSALAEAIARGLAASASSAIYAGATTGQEATLTTLTASSLAKLLGLLDPSLLPGAKFYMSPADAATVFGSSSGILANTSARALFGIPVQVTNACTTYTSGTVSGPILANLQQAAVLRSAGLQVQLAQEATDGTGGTSGSQASGIDFLQVTAVASLRANFALTGQVTGIAYSK